MAVTVENLDKLERRITLTLPADAINTEVQSRLRGLARKVKIDGFRPGKVPMGVVAQRHGLSVQYEVMNEKVGEAFAKAASEAKLRVAGMPRIAEKADAPAGQLAFDATFEVYPEIRLPDLAALQLDKVSTEITDEAIERTLQILRTQRRTFADRAADEVAQDTDRVTIDFDGKIDGVPFEGGKADGFQFILGEGRMLEQFERAVRGMKAGESKTFPLSFPADYHGKDVAGKEADFLVTLTRIEVQQLPEVNDEFAQSLGVATATVDGLRDDIRNNLQREVKFRLTARNKQAVLDALTAAAQLDLPKSLVQAETEQMVQRAREELKSRGIKDVDKVPIPAEGFLPQAERRVKTALVIGELVRVHQLQARAEQIKAHIDELSKSYESPAEVAQWYYSDSDRMANVQAVVVENNVTQFVLQRAQVTDKAIAFDELMRN